MMPGLCKGILDKERSPSHKVRVQEAKGKCSRDVYDNSIRSGSANRLVTTWCARMTKINTTHELHARVSTDHSQVGKATTV